MAAGLGTRMKSSRPKHLHPLLGRRLLDWVLEAVRPLDPSPFVVVVSPESREELRASLADEFELAIQEEPRGTGDAIAAARDRLEDFRGDVLVVAGDSPLLTSDVLEDLVAAHRRESAAVTVLSIEPNEPRPYGRLLRDERGELAAIVEETDATPEQLAVRELNSSTYVFSGADLWRALGRLEAANAQGEIYLTDAVRHLVADGRRAAVYRAADPRAGDGVNTRDDLAQATAALRERVVREHMVAGVTVVDPSSTWIEPDVSIEPDAVIHPFTILRGRTVVRAGAEVGPHAVVVDSEIGRDCSVWASIVEGSVVEDGVTIGPLSHLRPGSHVGAGSEIGNFAEIKNSRLGPGVRQHHASYLGDADVGAGTNVGAGSITANYDGSRKHRTTIGERVFLGVDTMLRAPVTIGDDARTGAGAVVTRDVPPRTLAVGVPARIRKPRPKPDSEPR